MALLVVLQQLKPTERAVLLLHDVFDFDHASISALVGKSAPACRKLLERARQRVAEERRTMTASPEEHARLLRAFLAAASAGDTRVLLELLAEGRAAPLIGGEFDLADVVTALRHVADGRAVGKVLLQVAPGG